MARAQSNIKIHEKATGFVECLCYLAVQTKNARHAPYSQYDGLARHVKHCLILSSR